MHCNITSHLSITQCIVDRCRCALFVGGRIRDKIISELLDNVGSTIRQKLPTSTFPIRGVNDDDDVDVVDDDDDVADVDRDICSQILIVEQDINGTIMKPRQSIGWP